MKMFKKITLIIIAVITLIHIIHAVTFDQIVEYKEIAFSSEKIPPELDGYKIAFIADTHYSHNRLRGITERLNNEQIDLLLLGGDYSENYGGELCMEILSQVATADGIFGVDGNHDNHELLFENMQAHGIIPLRNTGLYIKDGFFLAGVEDLWQLNPCIETAIDSSTSEDFVLLLSHNPDVAMQQDTTGVDLILSGHTHGGQIALFGIWTPALGFVTEYGNRFKSGWADSHDGTPIYVSRGVGQHIIRVFARPQVIILTLESK
jgi:hypothetical protein